MLRLLEELGFKCRGVDDSARRVVGVVIVDEDGMRYISSRGIDTSQAVVLTAIDDPICTVLKAVILCQQLSIPCRELVVGIDMGKNIGVAVVCDSRCVLAKSFRTALRALEMISNVFRCIDASRRVIRIGMPKKECGEYEEFVEKLVKIVGEDIELELIPEKGSSSFVLFLKTGRKIDDDALAAINIALMRSS